jgi:hypothetical protein
VRGGAEGGDQEGSGSLGHRVQYTGRARKSIASAHALSSP